MCTGGWSLHLDRNKVGCVTVSRELQGTQLPRGNPNYLLETTRNHPQEWKPSPIGSRLNSPNFLSLSSYERYSINNKIKQSRNSQSRVVHHQKVVGIPNFFIQLPFSPLHQLKNTARHYMLSHNQGHFLLACLLSFSVICSYGSRV